jgi:hypothetical protein
VYTDVEQKETNAFLQTSIGQKISNSKFLSRLAARGPIKAGVAESIHPS